MSRKTAAHLYCAALCILCLLVIPSVWAGAVPQEWSQKDGINFAGVNLVWMGGASEWMVFKPGCYQKTNVEGYLKKVSNEFNLVRVCVGARHVLHPGISDVYLQNLLHTLKTAQARNLWFQIAFWPTDVTSTCGEYEEKHWDPYFHVSNKIQYAQALRTVAQLLVDNNLVQNLLYIDIRNELSGHIGGTYDSRGSVAWGELPVDAVPYYRDWLKTKYGSINALNTAWGGSFPSFENVPLYGSGNANTTVDSTYGHPDVVKKDQQDWIVWAFRDWTTTMKQAVTSVDPRIRVGQSTTESQMHANRLLSDFTNTNDIFRQSDIGGIVDVFDFHSYKRYGGGGDYVGEFVRLKNGWPDTIYVMGETWNENDQVLKIIEGGGDGILFWDEPGNPQIWNRGRNWSDPDSWTLTEHGQKFIQQIGIRKAYIYPDAQVSKTPTGTPLLTLTPSPSAGTPTSVPTGAVKSGDANADGKVDGVDYTIWLTNYLATTNKGALVGDFNRDGRVDGVDYTLWLTNYLT